MVVTSTETTRENPNQTMHERDHQKTMSTKASATKPAPSG